MLREDGGHGFPLARERRRADLMGRVGDILDLIAGLKAKGEPFAFRHRRAHRCGDRRKAGAKAVILRE
jgi:hypothetical protein